MKSSLPNEHQEMTGNRQPRLAPRTPFSSRNMTKRRRTPPPCGDRRRRWPQKLQRCGPTSSDAGMKELEQILEREEMGLVLSDPAALEMKLSSLYELLQFHNLPQSILLHLWKPLGLCFNHSD
ncbi:bis(5'-adenosyl)-triphosphatase isoform X4 [Camelus bactrianus]|uniref:Bis(5'-adenosyl)-triphosphatase isoform X4 n=1 Tax=Camelus bactrianus TaxID=9837 RepID=A0AC58NSE0_CAMBA